MSQDEVRVDQAKTLFDMVLGVDNIVLPIQNNEAEYLEFK